MNYKKILLGLGCATASFAISALVHVGINSKSNAPLSCVELANVEALASGEDDDWIQGYVSELVHGDICCVFALPTQNCNYGVIQCKQVAH